jgi:hypothetical protein
MRFLFWIIALPVLAFAGAFAAANPGPITLKLWPFPLEIALPVYAAVLGPFFAGFLLAAIWFWLKSLPGRLARRRLARHEQQLEEETRRLKDELAAAERRGPEASDEARRRMIANAD